MKGEDKTKDQLIDELSQLRQRIAELEAADTERKRAEEELRKSEASLAEAQRIAHIGNWDWDIISDELRWSDEIYRIFGLAPKEFGATYEAFLSSVHPDDREFVKESVNKALYENKLYSIDHRIVLPDDSERIVHEQAKVFLDETNRAIRMIGTVQDITERKQAEEALSKVNRALKTLSECNQALVRATEESDLLHDICRIIVEVGGYRLAWVGFAEQDEGKTVRPVARAGCEEGYLETVKITWADTEGGRGPTGKAIRTGAPSVARDILTAPDFEPWRAEALKRGYASSVALPLIANGWTIGALNIYAAESDAFDREEVKLLTELADDLAYGIAALRTRAERKRAEEALRESEERYHDLIESTYDIIQSVAPDGRFVFVNRAWLETLGYTEAELPSLNLWEIIHPESLLHCQKAFSRVMAGESIRNVQATFVAKDGRSLLVEGNATGRYVDGRLVATHGFFRDITERKRAEEELQHTLEKLRKALGGIIQAMALTVETRDPYTAGHQRRVTDLARAIATEMGLSEEQIDGIRMAGVVHDLGKISVPAGILNKPGRLSKNEFGIIQTHPEVGYAILKRIEFPWPVAQIVLQHHERVDGSGYPSGLSGEEILLEARILAVADVIEAMSSHRPYRPALGIDKALEEISRNRGVLYDPEVVGACLRLFTEKGFEFEQDRKSGL